MTLRIRAVFDWFADPLHMLLTLFSLIPIFFVILYMASYGRNVPFADQWHFSSEIAIAAKNGTLSPDLLLKQYNDHRVFFTNLGTAASAYFLDWDTRAEMWVNLVLALGYFGLLLSILWQREKPVFVFALLPLTAVVFSLNQQYNWLLGHHTGWHYILLFMIGGLWVLQTYAPGWKPLLTAAVLSLCATFSFGSGSISWALLLGAMWMFGYRRWYHFAFWIAAAVVSVALYNAGGGVPGSTQTESFGVESIRFQDPLGIILYILALLGNAVTWFDLPAARIMATAGLVVYALNVFFLWYPRRDWARVAPWLVLGGYGIGASAGIALARFDSATPENALINRFVGASLPFWFALVALMVIVIYHLWDAGWRRGLLMVNIIFAAVLTLSYLRASAFTLQIAQESFRYNHRLSFNPAFKFEENCMLSYPLTRDFSCFEQITGWIDGSNIDEHTYRLAAYKLTIFADQKPVPILQDTHHPVIIDSPTRWLNVYIRDWMLQVMDDSLLFHIAPPENALLTDDLPHPLGKNRAEVFSEDTLQAVLQFIAGYDTVWYLFTPETAEHESAFTDALRTADYFPTVIPITQERYQDGGFRLVRFQHKPDDTREHFRFGDNITLQAWILYPENPQPCDTLTLESWWLVDGVPDFNYSATLVLTNASGEGVVRADGELAGIPMQLWQPDQFFFDTRSLQLPCDLPPGAYHLQYGIYNYETLQDLPIAESAGTRAALLNITIN